MKWKIPVFLIFGALCLLFGSLLIGTLAAVSDSGGYLTTLVVAFVLYLLGGFLWVSVAVAVRSSS